MKKFLFPLFVVAASLLLAACAAPAEKAAKACAEPGAVTYTTDGRTYDCAQIRGGAPSQDTPSPAADGEFIAGEAKTIAGPAIVQLWDGKTVPGCGIYKIPAGRQLTWALRGHWWLFEGVSPDAFNAAFAASEADYNASNPQCTMKAPPLK